MPSTANALEFSKATEEYARLAKELLSFPKSHPEYEAKALELAAARERCEKARNALKAIRVTRRRKLQNEPLP
jgi:hypothetical protein